MTVHQKADKMADEMAAMMVHWTADLTVVKVDLSAVKMVSAKVARLVSPKVVQTAVQWDDD